MKTLIVFFSLTSILFGSLYLQQGNKGYLLKDQDLRIISSQGIAKLPLFGIPNSIIMGQRPYVLTSKALFAIDATKEGISNVFRLDISYTKAVIGAKERLYLLGGKELTVIQGSGTKMSILYTYGLPVSCSDMFYLPSGHLFFIPSSGLTAFTYNPNNKATKNIKLAWKPKYPLLAGSVLFDKDTAGIRFFHTSTGSASFLNLGAEVCNLLIWRGRILVSTSSELLLIDPVNSSIINRLSIPAIRKFYAVDNEDFATVLTGNNLITVGLPDLIPRDTFNASCAGANAAYPFLGKPLFVCGDKLALPGISQKTQHYMVYSLNSLKTQAYSLQVGAFSDISSFGALMEMLARQGLPYYMAVEGDLTKFRIGFFKTREDADLVRSYLEDYGAWVVTESSTHPLTHSLHDINRDGRPDGALARGDSVLILTLSDKKWIEFIKTAQLPEQVQDIYFKGEYRLFVNLKQSGVVELTLPDSLK